MITLKRPAGPEPGDGFETVTAQTFHEQQDYIQAGFRVVETIDTDSDDTDDIKALREAYAGKFGKKPFNGWDADTLREKLAA